MGDVEKEDDLSKWLTNILKYKFVTKQYVIQISLMDKIYKDMEYYWSNDRMAVFKQNDPFIAILPNFLKADLILNHIFSDVFHQSRIFREFEQKDFLIELAYGFMPRHFDKNDPADRVIYDEGEEVSELYYMMNCEVGVAINSFSHIMKTQYTVGKLLSGNIILFDYEILKQKKTEFIYIARNNIDAFGLNRKFLEDIFKKYPNVFNTLLVGSILDYESIIRVPMLKF